MFKSSIILALITLIMGCKPIDRSGTTIRPADFPDFLKPPENAIDVRYKTQETGDIIDNAYSISYFIEEDFPPRMLMDFVHNQLYDAGFFPLKYSLLNLTMRLGYAWHQEELSEPGYVHLQWTEDWLSSNSYKVINILFQYRYKKGHKDLSRIFVYISYDTEQSEIAEFAKRYKEYYPEEEWEADLNDIDYDKIWKEED